MGGWGDGAEKENKFALRAKCRVGFAWLIRDGPLENLYGGEGGGGEVPKIYSRKAKLNEKKFMHAN